MRTHIFTIIVAAVLVILNAGETPACNTEPTAVISPADNPLYVGPGDLTFDASGSYDNDEDDADGDGEEIESYSWDFGNGETSTEESYTTNYSAAGSPYTVSLTVTDDEDETNTATCTLYVIEVAKIEYNDPADGWTEVTETLYVLKEDTVEFRAIRNLSEASWPSGKPVWGGEASGSGDDTVSVTFSTLSPSTTDPFEVTAECGNTVTVNMIVYQFEGIPVPQDEFDFRDYSRYGISELVDLRFGAEPDVSASQIGGLEWTLTGVGEVTTTDENGDAEYDAKTCPGPVEFKLTILSGPSQGQNHTYSKTVIAPDGLHHVRKGTKLWHVHNTYSVGFRTYMYLRPKDVSFMRAYVREGYCEAVADGWLEEYDEVPHLGGANWTPVGPGNFEDGCWIMAFDEARTEPISAPYGTGSFRWYIPNQYREDASNRVQYGITLYDEIAGSDGKASLTKGDSETCSRIPSDPTSNWD